MVAVVVGLVVGLDVVSGSELVVGSGGECGGCECECGFGCGERRG
jgi:hypothetical protein